MKHTFTVIHNQTTHWRKIFKHKQTNLQIIFQGNKKQVLWPKKGIVPTLYNMLETIDDNGHNKKLMGQNWPHAFIQEEEEEEAHIS